MMIIELSPQSGGPHPEKVIPRDVFHISSFALPQHFLCTAKYLETMPLPLDVCLDLS